MARGGKSTPEAPPPNPAVFAEVGIFPSENQANAELGREIPGDLGGGLVWLALSRPPGGGPLARPAPSPKTKKKDGRFNGHNGNK